jgi:hypothetical protein
MIRGAFVGKMPSTKELIDRLMADSRYFIRLALVVGYPTGSVFIWNDYPDPLGELDRHVEAGGTPFALMGYVATSEGYGFHARLLDEYVRDPRCKTMLNKTLEDAKQQLKSEGFTTKSDKRRSRASRPIS